MEVVRGNIWRPRARIVADIQRLLSLGEDGDADADEVGELELVHLWDPDLGPVEAGTNYAGNGEW